MELIIIRGWEHILPGVRLGSMYDPQPISDWPVGLGFPPRTGRFRPGGSPFSFPGRRIFKGIE